MMCSARSLSEASSRSASPSPGLVEPAIGFTEARSAVPLDERLGRRPDQGELAKLEQEQVRRRVDVAERPVQRERRDARRPLGTLREHDLECVAEPDVLLAGEHAALVVRLGRETLRRAVGARRSRRRGDLALEQLDRTVVAPYDLGDSERVIEANERVGGDETALRQVAPGVRQRHGRLELRDVVVAEIPDDRLVGAATPPRRRGAASRSRRASSAQAGPARPTRAGSSPFPHRAGADTPRAG